MAYNPGRLRRDAKAMEQRQLAAIARVERGDSFSSLARQLGVSRQTVFVWARQLRRRGEAGLHCRPRSGRPSKLDRAQMAQLPRLLTRGAEAIDSLTNRLGLSFNGIVCGAMSPTFPGLVLTRR